MYDEWRGSCHTSFAVLNGRCVVRVLVVMTSADAGQQQDLRALAILIQSFWNIFLFSLGFSPGVVDGMC